MKPKNKLPQQVNSDKEYWGRISGDQPTPISKDHFPISPKQYREAMIAGKRAIKSFQSNIDLTYKENVPFEKEYLNLSKRYNVVSVHMHTHGIK